MKTTIHKYKIGPASISGIRARSGPVRHVGADPQGDLCVWIEVDPNEEELHVRKFLIVGTGGEVPDNRIVAHVGSTVEGAYVFHIYEVQPGF